jgi:hypothetical protein
MKSILKLLVLAALCASADAWAKVDAKFERWLGRTTAQVLEAGDRVEVFVVGPQPVGSRGSADDNTGKPLPPEAPTTVQRYPVRQVGPGQGRAFAQQIARLVFDERSYEPRMYPFGRSEMKACAFAPGVAFRVWARTRAVDVLVSFGCDEIAVAYVGGKREMLVGDIDPARAAFVRLAKSVLADVPEVATLAEVRAK